MQDLHLRANALGEANDAKTRYPSKDKPGLKYYSQEAIAADLPECMIYEYMLEQNRNNLDRITLNYYGTNADFETGICVASCSNVRYRSTRRLSAFLEWITMFYLYTSY